MSRRWDSGEIKRRTLRLGEPKMPIWRSGRGKASQHTDPPDKHHHPANTFNSPAGTDVTASLALQTPIQPFIDALKTFQKHQGDTRLGVADNLVVTDPAGWTPAAHLTE